MGVTGAAKPGIYELGGPRCGQLPRADAADAGRHPPPPLIVNVPFWIAGIMGPVFDLLQTVTLGCFTTVF
jgi:hypothetical protein